MVSEQILVLSGEIQAKENCNRKEGQGEGYWCRCFIAAAQRMMKKPIQSAARWNGMAS